MTVAELIQELQKFPPDTLVLKGHHYDEQPRWSSMDGWWPQMVTVVTAKSALFEGWYYEPSKHETDTDTIDALEI